MDEKKKKIQNGTTKSEPNVNTNLEKKVWEKLLNMTKNDALTADFVLKNRRLLKSLKNCRVKLSKSLKSKPTKKSSKTTQKNDQEKSSNKPTTNSSPSTSKQLLKTSPPQNRIQSPKIFIRLPAKNRKCGKNSIKSLLRANLSKKFDRNLFKCHVRVKRLKKSNPLFTKKLKANRKTVSFMETVEIFGESDIVYVSDSDLDSNNDDTVDMEDDSFVGEAENPSTSTPILNSTGEQNSFKARRSLLDGKRCVVRLNRRASRINFSITSEATGDEHDENENGDVVMKEPKASEEIALETTAQELNLDDKNIEITEETAKAGATAEQENEVIISDVVEETENSEVEPQVNGEDVSNKSNQSSDSTKIDESSPEANTDEATDGKLADATTSSHESEIVADATTSSHESEIVADATTSSHESEIVADATTSSHESKIVPDVQKSTASTTKTNGTIRLSPDLVDSHPPEDLFDLLKSDKLPPNQPPSLSTDPHPKIPDFLDSDDEDVSTSNKTLQNNPSNCMENSTNSPNSSRFSLNTFFKSVKDTIMSARSGSNSPRSSPANRIELPDSPTTTAQ